MKRRAFLLRTAVIGATMAAPAIVRAQSATTLRYIPPADLGFLDPYFSSAWVTRNHAMMVYDALYGIGAKFVAQPQMVAGHTVENGGKTWTLTLRDDLRFHDHEPVRARDVVASLRCWAAPAANGDGPIATPWKPMRTEWFSGVAGDADRTLWARMQAQAFQGVLYMPTGIFFQPTAHHRSLVDRPKMFAVFYGVKRQPS